MLVDALQRAQVELIRTKENARAWYRAKPEITT